MRRREKLTLARKPCRYFFAAAKARRRAWKTATSRAVSSSVGGCTTF